MSEHTPIRPQPTSMRRIHQGAGLVFLALGLFVVSEALKLRYYTSLGPGPGFFSYWLGVLLSVLAVLMILRASFGPTERPATEIFADKIAYIRIGTVFIGMVALVLLLKLVGFPLTMAAFIALVLMSGGVSLRAIIAGAFLGGVVAFYVFSHLLGVPLPAGITPF